MGDERRNGEAGGKVKVEEVEGYNDRTLGSKHQEVREKCNA